MRLQRGLNVAGLIQADVNEAGLGEASKSPLKVGRSLLERFDEIVSNESIGQASRDLFRDGYYARSVEEAFKCVNNHVKAKSGLTSEDGDGLMRKAFSPAKPALKLNRLKSISQKSEQRGYMDLFAGGMAGIRNPRAHEHRLQDDPVSALEMLSLANHLMRKLGAATKTRSK